MNDEIFGELLTHFAANNLNGAQTIKEGLQDAIERKKEQMKGINPNSLEYLALQSEITALGGDRHIADVAIDNIKNNENASL